MRDFFGESRGDVTTQSAREKSKIPGKIRIDKPERSEAMEPIKPSRVGNWVNAVKGITNRIAATSDLEGRVWRTNKTPISMDAKVAASIINRIH